MLKKELQRRYAQIDSGNDKEKELYLRNLEKSLYNYIRVGVENKQLEDLSQLEEEFQEKYENMFRMRNIVKDAFEDLNTADRFLHYQRKYLLEQREKSSDEYSVQVFTDYLAEEFCGLIQDKLEKVIKDVAYLSHMNMLYNLYEREKEQQNVEKTYEQAAARFDKLSDIIEGLSRNRRMSFETICTEFHIPEEELDKLLIRENQYFNIRQKANSIQVSLSPSGRKYNRYIISSKEGYSKEYVEQLLSKNCRRIVDNLEHSWDRGVEYELRLEGVSPDGERVLQYKYHNIVQKLLSEKEETYRRYRIEDEEGGAYKNERIIYKREVWSGC